MVLPNSTSDYPGVFGNDTSPYYGYTTSSYFGNLSNFADGSNNSSEEDRACVAKLSQEYCAIWGISDPNICLGAAEHCPATIWFVPILLAFYLLLTNILMLNLLIAIFR